MNQSDFYPIVNIRKLPEILELSSSKVSYLISNEIIRTKVIGKTIIVNNTDLKNFQLFFNKNTYMLKSDVLSKLKDKNYLGEYLPSIKMYDKSFMGFQHTFNMFVENGYLDLYRIDSTTYVSIKSFNNLLEILDKTHSELYPNKEYQRIHNLTKNRFVNSRRKKIKIKNCNH